LTKCEEIFVPVCIQGSKNVLLMFMSQYFDSSDKTHTTKGKGKAVLLQAWSGPEGFRKLRFPDFMTVAQDGGKVVSHTHQLPLPPGNTPGTHFC
jgi:hypothetical protein